MLNDVREGSRQAPASAIRRDSPTSAIRTRFRSLFDAARLDAREAVRDPLPNLLAGLTVAVVALPLALAFGLIAFGPHYGPAAGLWSAIIVGFLASLLGGAPYAITGPTGVLAVYTGALVASHGGFASSDAILFGFLAVSLSGVFQIVLGAMRLGRVIEFIPYPVINGFMNGIALIILWSGVKDVIAPFDGGLSDGAPSIAALHAFATGAAPTHVYMAAVLATVAFSMAFFWPTLTRRVRDGGAAGILKRVPGSLLALILLTAVAASVSLFDGVHRIRELPTGLPAFSLDFSLFTRHPDWADDLVLGALGLAAISSMDTLLTCVVADAVVGRKTNGNRELVAQGIGNSVAGMFGANQSCGAAVRTMVNVRNGGRTRLSGMSHALILLLILLLGARLATLVPIAVLSGILLTTGIGMIEWRAILEANKAPRSDTAVMLVTTVSVVVLGLVEAVFIGVVLAAFLFIKRMTELTDFVAEPEWVGTERRGLEGIEDRVLVYEIRGPLFFGPAARFTGTFERADLKRVEVILFRMNAVTAVDETGLRAMEVIVERLRRNGQTVILSHVPEATRERFERFGLVDRIGRENVVARFDDATRRARDVLGELAAPPTHG